MNFKECLSKDIKNAFFNKDELAEVKVFYIKDKRYELPVVIESDITKDRNKPSVDHAEGIILSYIILYISVKDLEYMPKRNQKIELDNEIYKIVKADNQDGTAVLYLEMFDE